MQVSKRTLSSVFGLACRESNSEIASNLIWDIVTKPKWWVNRKRLAYFYRHPSICKVLGMRLYKIKRY